MRPLISAAKRTTSRRRPGPLLLTPVACVVWGLLGSAGVHAQAADEEGIQLKTSPLLQDQPGNPATDALPTFLQGERTFGRPDLETVVEGNAELRRGDMLIRADRLEYFQPDDLARARGNVYINKAGNVYQGPLLELKVEAFEGFFTQPSYRFLKNGAHGEADRVDFLSDQRIAIKNATYTTCERTPGPSWMPDWILRAASIDLDNAEEVGLAKGAVLTFKGIPILPIPILSFPLSDKRKSGVLPPTFGLDSVNGVEVTLPYYWNIAPNRDATVFPTLMSKRGINLGGEFRYLEPAYNGQVRLDTMPDDRLRQQTRWGYSYTHQGSLKGTMFPDSGVGLSLNLNRVSDDNYWKDFTRVSSSLTQRLLSSDMTLNWSGWGFSNSVRALKWQTLQDVTAPITPPYDRLPQVATQYTRSGVNGFDFSFNADYTRFQSDRLLTGQPNAQRAFALAQVSRPWQTPSGFLTPKLQLHTSNYQFDTPLTNGAVSASRTVPTFSLDSGLVFERDASYFGRALRQTLEPRAFYVYTPFRDQSSLPIYDSGATDFNFANIYTENAFVGNDRISDNNLLTLGLTSRLLDPDTGAEAARFGVAQRLRFKDQNVTLPGGVPVADRISDVLLGASLNWDPQWTFDTTVQFNPKTRRSERSTIGARYSPGNYRVISAAYRFQKDLSEQLDIGWQWPINDLWGDKGQDLGPGQGQGGGRWYSVGRLNFSLKDGKLVDSVVGLEFDACCWLGRVVLERLQTGTTSATQRIMFQLEFVGFSRLGSNPLKTLKENIPRYQYLREQTSSPSRFSNYD